VCLAPLVSSRLSTELTGSEQWPFGADVEDCSISESGVASKEKFVRAPYFDAHMNDAQMY